MNGFDLEDYDLTVSEVHHNLPPSALYEHAIRHDKDASIAASWHVSKTHQSAGS